MKLTKEEIKKIIPHREPFLLVDEMLEVVPGEKGVGKWTLTGEEWFFKGHFPTFKVTPGVLLTEALAQAGAVIICSHPDYQDKMGLFGGIKSMKFKRMVKPGDTVTLEVDITRKSHLGGYADVVAKVGDEVACIGEIMTVFTKKAEPADEEEA